MDGAPAQYLGRIVSKQNFRAFIHAPEGQKKLVNSWDEFERHMALGTWFATEQEAKDSVVIEEPVIANVPAVTVEELKKRNRSKKKPVEEKEELIVPEMSRDDVSLDLKDDFLSEVLE